MRVMLFVKAAGESETGRIFSRHEFAATGRFNDEPKAVDLLGSEMESDRVFICGYAGPFLAQRHLGSRLSSLDISILTPDKPSSNFRTIRLHADPVGRFC